MVDESRKRSLYFLLMTEARKQTLQSGNIEMARSITSNLDVIEAEDSWLVTSKVDSTEISVEVPKKKFQFYPTKNAESYEIEPSILNKQSAASVINDLYQRSGIELELHVEKNKRKIVNRNLNFNPQHFVLVGLIGLSLIKVFFALPSSIVNILGALLFLYPLALLIGSTTKPFVRFSLIPYFISVFSLSSYALGSIKPTDGLKFLLMVAFIELLHHKVLSLSPRLFQILVSLILLCHFFLSTKSFWGQFYLPVVSLLILSLIPSITEKLKFRKWFFTFGLILYGATSILFALNFSFWPIFLLFTLGQSFLLALFGFRESPAKLYLGMAFLAL
jgi:hypothetical protein